MKTLINARLFSSFPGQNFISHLELQSNDFVPISHSRYIRGDMGTFIQYGLVEGEFETGSMNY